MIEGPTSIVIKLLESGSHILFFDHSVGLQDGLHELVDIDISRVVLVSSEQNFHVCQTFLMVEQLFPHFFQIDATVDSLVEPTKEVKKVRYFAVGHRSRQVSHFLDIQLIS